MKWHDKKMHVHVNGIVSLHEKKKMKKKKEK